MPFPKRFPREGFTDARTKARKIVADHIESNPEDASKGARKTWTLVLKELKATDKLLPLGVPAQPSSVYPLVE